MIWAREAVDSLIVQCKRGDLGTNAVLLTAFPDHVELTFGNPSMGGVMEVSKEYLPFEKHPELKRLRGMCGWNTQEVQALVGGLEDISPEETQRPQ